MATSPKAFKCTEAQWRRAEALLSDPPEALRVILASHRNPSTSVVLKAALEIGLTMTERDRSKCE